MTKPLSEDERMLAADYVCGNLSQLASTEFESWLAQDPDLQTEVNALEMAFDRILQSLPQVMPPPTLKGRIMAEFNRIMASDR